MSRNMYGATSADFTLTSGGRPVPGAELTIWDARTGGTQITDLLDVNSAAFTIQHTATDVGVRSKTHGAMVVSGGALKKVPSMVVVQGGAVKDVTEAYAVRSGAFTPIIDPPM